MSRHRRAATVVTELRFDPLGGDWVILAPGRAKRPHEAQAPSLSAAAPVDCPFCAGQEHRTPPEVARRGPGAPDQPGWSVRVFPNRFAIVGEAAAEVAPSVAGLRQRLAATGVHEVAVLSPDHDSSLARLDVPQVVEVLLALRDRSRVHAAEGHRYTQLMINHGAAGGASLTHPHAQLVAIDVDPPAVMQELGNIARADECLICSELRSHSADRSLVVAGTDVELWCPWWSATAYDMLLAPRLHRPCFEDAEEELSAVAATLRHGLQALDRTLSDPPYNVVFHSRPAGMSEDFHWHVHIRPRLQQEAGFEIGTGILVNTLDPVEAAAQLR